QNVIDFYNRYQETIKVVVLKENYRSAQAILDKATASIGNNKQRLVYQLEQLKLDKHIHAANERFLTEDVAPPVVRMCYNQLHEEAYVVSEIEALQQSGVALNNVAVLYVQHKQAANIISLLEK